MSNVRAYNPVMQFFNDDGSPMVGGHLNTYKAGTSIPVTTYADESGTLNPRSIPLNSRGECTVYLTAGMKYKFVLLDKDNVVKWTADNYCINASEGGGGGTDIEVSYDDEGKALVFSNEFAIDDPQETNEVEKIVDGAGLEFDLRDNTKESLANKVTSVRTTDEATDEKYPSERAVSVGFAALAAAISTLWTNAVAAFQTIANKVTSIRAVSSASDDKYPSEKAVADKLLDYALVKKTYGKQGYISGASSDPDVLVEKIKLGLLSLYNEGVTVKVYEFDEDDEENAVLVWDSSTLTGNELNQYRNGLQMSNIYISPAGKWVKVSYTGSTNSYIRTLGIFMTPKYADSSHVAFAKLRLNDAEYDWNRITTYGSLVTAVVTDSTKATCNVIFKPESSAVRMRFFGFRCLNTYTGSDAVLLGRSTSALKLYTARKLKTNLARTSDSTFDGSVDQVDIPVKGTLPVANGGTGKVSVTAGNYVVGAGTSAMVEKAPKDVGSDVLSSLDNKSDASSYADFVDGDFVVGSDHVNASTISASTFVRRTALNLWNYIRSKLSGSDVNIGGNAATATTARDFDPSTGTIRSALAGKSDTGHVHNTDANEVTSNSTNLEVVTDTTEIVTTNTSGYSSSDKKLYRRPIKSKLWPWIASNLESEAGYINYTYNVTSDTNINSHVLAGIILPGSSLGSCRLMFAMVVNFNIGEGAGCGGLVKVHIEISGGGIYYVKRISLSNVTGDLSISDLKIVEGTSANKKVVGLVWNGVLLANRPMQATVLSRHVVGGDFVYNGDVASGTNIAWETGGARVWAEDGNVVHTTGDETIQGLKTFSNTTAGNDLDINLQSVTNNGTYKMGVEIAASGRRGLWDYNGTGISGEGKWIIFKDTDNVVNVGDATSNVKIGGTKFVFGASQLGSDANTFYWV